jgi:hypothetical protein
MGILCRRRAEVAGMFLGLFMIGVGNPQILRKTNAHHGSAARDATSDTRNDFSNAIRPRCCAWSSSTPASVRLGWPQLLDLAREG